MFPISLYVGRSDNMQTFCPFSKPVNYFSKKIFLVFLKAFPNCVYILLRSPWKILYSLCKPWSIANAEVPIYSWNPIQAALVSYLFPASFFQLWKHIKATRGWGKIWAVQRVGQQLTLEGFNTSYCRWVGMRWELSCKRRTFFPGYPWTHLWVV